MKVGELFIEIGMQGAQKVGSTLVGVQKGLSGVLDASLATKAAVIGVAYALQRLTMDSAEMGTNLLHFSEATGLSSDQLQSWQNDARRFAVDAGQVQSSIGSLQKIMMSMVMGEGAPKGMARLQQYVEFDPSRARDTFYVMGRLQEFAKKVPADIANATLATFGLSDEMIQYLRRTNTDMTKIQGTILNRGKLNLLEQVNKEWKELFRQFQLLGADLSAKYGLPLVQQLVYAGKGFSRLGKMIEGSTDAMKAFAVIAGGIALTIAPITTAITGLIYLLAEWEKHKEGKNSIFSDEGFFGKKGSLAKWFFGEPPIPTKGAGTPQPEGFLSTQLRNALSPVMGNPNRSPNSVDNSITNVFNGVKDAEDAVNKINSASANQRTYRKVQTAVAR